MKKTLHFVIALILIFTIYGCDYCIQGKTICTDLFSFRVVDKITHKDLIFTSTPVYNRDSVYLQTTLIGYSGNMAGINNNKYTSSLGIPVDMFYLRLSATDTDTLQMKFDFLNDKCCLIRGFGRITEIKYNGVTAKKEGDVYLFEK